MVAFWSIKSHPNLKPHALQGYKYLVRFEWEETQFEEAKRNHEISKGRFKEKLDG